MAALWRAWGSKASEQVPSQGLSGPVQALLLFGDLKGAAIVGSQGDECQSSAGEPVREEGIEPLAPPRVKGQEEEAEVARGLGGGQ